MSEWTVVLILITVSGFVISVMRPILSLNTAMTKLTCGIKQLSDFIDNLTSKNTQAHQRLWDHNEEQDEKINNHETRLQIIEKEKGGEKK